jgi:hypothetical protein
MMAYPFSFVFFRIVRSSSGTGSGTGSPDSLTTEENFGGHTSKQVPHRVHLS